MRNVQVGMFVLGVVLFPGALLFIGQEIGDTLWRAGVAAMLIDVACASVWPSAKGSESRSARSGLTRD
jgi:hypothetical protein